MLNFKPLTPEQIEIGNKILKSFGFCNFSGSITDDNTLYCSFNSGAVATIGSKLGKKLKKAFKVKRVMRDGTEI